MNRFSSFEYASILLQGAALTSTATNYSSGCTRFYAVVLDVRADKPVPNKQKVPAHLPTP